MVEFDNHIDYNDEIVSIEVAGEEDTMDITVSGDHLFYANGILTKNSFGLPQTADLQIALVTSEDLEKDSLLMVKQLKNRYADTSKYRRFTIRVDRSKMRLSNDPNQQYLSDPIPAPSGGGGAPSRKPSFTPATLKPERRRPLGISSANDVGGSPKITF